MADINDVYAWMTSDGTKINLALTVSPFDNGTRVFGPTVQYAFHLTRHAAFPASAELLAMGQESKVVCTLASDTSGECWVIDPANKVVDYVKGDMSGDAGATSASGKLKVFAGRRSDPFFFNLAGFLTAQGKVELACGGGATLGDCPGALATAPGLDAAGCPQLPAAVTGPIANDLKTTQATMVGPCAANVRDCFATANVMAIVVQVDTALVTTDAAKMLGVYASTHAAP